MNKRKLCILMSILLLYCYIINVNAKITTRNKNENCQLHPNRNEYYMDKITRISCPKGFATDYTRLGMKCWPICPFGCPWHSTCTGPNACECDTGYRIKDSQCQPDCRGCNHGFCYKPDHCICDFGYRLNSDQTCVPVCRDDCVNGRCVAPDVCECLPGYRLTRIVKDYCEPNCRPACYNAYCLKPEFCLCPHATDPQQNEWRAVSTLTDHLQCVRVDNGHE